MDQIDNNFISKKNYNKQVKFDKISIGISLFIIGLLVGLLVTDVFKTKEEKATEKLMNIIKNYSIYYENDKVLREGALRGIVASLNDPYSVYLNEEELNEFYKQLNEESYAGMGVYLVEDGTYILITEVVKDSPADIAGLKAGDVFISVDGVDVKNKTIDEISVIIKGAKGDTREVVVARGDLDNTITTTVTLDLLENDTIIYEVTEVNNKKIGYLQVLSFSSEEITYNDFKNAMNAMEEENIDDLIIDVRNNPGGYLTTVSKMLDYFIDSDKPFMYEETTNDGKKPLYLNEYDSNVDYGIIVIANEYSASAAEIFSSTMKELGGYDLVGNTTYGKGIGQISTPIDEDETMWIKLTTFAWYTANDNWIQGIGVEPTIKVDLENLIELNFIDPAISYELDQVNIEIKEFQSLLIRLGYTTRNDGYFGTDTDNAIKEYQTDKELPITGVVDDLTAYHLNLDLIKYFTDNANDEQYQSALEKLLEG